MWYLHLGGSVYFLLPYKLVKVDNMEIIDWLCKNKEWVFSGIGITFITLMCASIRKIMGKKKEDQNPKAKIKQINNGVKNTQVGIQNNYYAREKENE